MPKAGKEITAEHVMAGLAEMEVVLKNLKIVFGGMQPNRVLAIGLDHAPSPLDSPKDATLPPRVGPVKLVGSVCRPVLRVDGSRSPADPRVRAGARPSGPGKTARAKTVEH